MKWSYTSGLRIPQEAFVDLQTHTVLSDGDWTPEALLDYFVQEQFAVVAITDHDRVNSVQELQHMASTRGLPLLVATEMTTRWRNSMVDILCFGFEQNPSPLSLLCDALLLAQQANSRKVYHALAEQGYIPIENELELENILNATTSRQPHLLFDLFMAYNPSKEQESFHIMQEVGYELCTHRVEEVVEATHQAGGVAIIAHPGRTDGYATFDALLLDSFRAEVPIDGIEAYYPRHTPEQTAFYEAYSKAQGWLISAGSDSHTPTKPPIKYPAMQCRDLLARLGILVG